MAKLQLTPNDVRNLLKDHSEIELQLREDATKQVANAMTNKLTEAYVEEKVKVALDSAINKMFKAVDDGYYNRKKYTLPDDLQKSINEDIAVRYKKAWEASTEQIVINALKICAPSLTFQVVNLLREEVRTMVFEEVVKLLKPKDQENA